MKQHHPPTSVVSFALESSGDASKLVSLLALATGAVAMPQMSHADIIFTDLSSSPVQVGANSAPSFLINNLPGAAQFFFAFGHRATTVTSSRFVFAGQNAG